MRITKSAKILPHEVELDISQLLKEIRTAALRNNIANYKEIVTQATSTLLYQITIKEALQILRYIVRRIVSFSKKKAVLHS